nr:unnamed protein product [Callosobruchus analis]
MLESILNKLNSTQQEDDNSSRHELSEDEEDIPTSPFLLADERECNNLVGPRVQSNALKVNTQLSRFPHSSAQEHLVKFDTALGTIIHGLLLQREAFVEALVALTTEDPSIKANIQEKLLADNAKFKSLSDDLLQCACGRRAEVIEQRRSHFRPRDKQLHTYSRYIPLQSFSSNMGGFARIIIIDQVAQTTHQTPLSRWKRQPPNIRRKVSSEQAPNHLQIPESVLQNLSISAVGAQQKEKKTREKQRISAEHESIDNQFRGGRLREFLPEWKQMSAPTNIINVIKGYGIPFATKPPLIRVEKLSANMIKVHKSVIVTFANPERSELITKSPLVQRMIKGIEADKSVPKRQLIWNVGQLITWITEEVLSERSLFQVSPRLAIILLCMLLASLRFKNRSK